MLTKLINIILCKWFNYHPRFFAHKQGHLLPTGAEYRVYYHCARCGRLSATLYENNKIENLEPAESCTP